MDIFTNMDVKLYLVGSAKICIVMEPILGNSGNEERDNVARDWIMSSHDVKEMSYDEVFRTADFEKSHLDEILEGRFQPLSSPELIIDLGGDFGGHVVPRDDATPVAAAGCIHYRLSADLTKATVIGDTGFPDAPFKDRIIASIMTPCVYM